MARRLWKVGTNSGNDGCPTLYAEPGTNTYVVQGNPVTDPPSWDSWTSPRARRP
ncbi:hypothetical protein [Streptomyces sp. NPDC096142]|uniref:hypothetical protein n=1 Tax=Streptomyces sp. NPDC096142 TaxID=3366077 RepID=UPI003827EBD2